MGQKHQWLTETDVIYQFDGGKMEFNFEHQNIYLKENKLVVDRNKTRVWGRNPVFSEFEITKILGFIVPFQWRAIDRIDIVLIENANQGTFNTYRKRKFRLYIKKDEVGQFETLISKLGKKLNNSEYKRYNFGDLLLTTKIMYLSTEFNEKTDLIKKFVKFIGQKNIKTSFIIASVFSILETSFAIADPGSTSFLILGIGLITFYAAWTSYWGIKYIFVKIYNNEVMRGIFNLLTHFFGLGYYIAWLVGIMFGFYGGGIIQFIKFNKKLSSDFKIP